MIYHILSDSIQNLRASLDDISMVTKVIINLLVFKENAKKIMNKIK